jgi:hypothetical protein
MKHLFTKYQKNAYLGALFLQNPQRIFNLLIIGLLVLMAEVVQAQSCSDVTMDVTVSGCYLSSGVSKATISVEVAWTNAFSTGDQITITGPSGSVPATRTIKIGNVATTYTGTDGTNFNTTVYIGSPQVVAFEVPANGASGRTVKATFSGCSAGVISETFNIPAACVASTCPSGQVGGTVFFDYNANGKKDAGETAGFSDTDGLGGVVVKIFDCKGEFLGSTITDIYGKYHYNVTNSASYPVRVEFSNLPSFAGSGTPNGTDSRTTVQFVPAADCTVDLGVLNSSDFCNTTPKLVLPCFAVGNPLNPSSQFKDISALIAFDYGNTGTAGPGDVTVLAKAKQVGTLWGVAYDKRKKRLFSSALLRRHSGLGPLGLGGIYVTDMTTNTTTNYANLATLLGINFGTVPDNDTRGLNGVNGRSNDAAAFPLIGKVGIGDMDISEDGQFLYLVNLHEKKLIKLDISGSSPTLAGSYLIPASCAGGNNRPFGLKVYQGKVYVGLVCDGSSQGNTSTLRAIVQSFDPTTTNFTEVFDFPLTYPKGPVFLTESSSDAFLLKLGIWNPWTDDFNDLNTGSYSNNNDSYRVIYPQPILSNIEFDIDGSMVLSFADRTGLQTGFQNYAPTGTSDLFSSFSGGDILRAIKSGNTFVLENNGKVDGINGAGVNNKQGPGFGEFYNDDFLSYSGKLNHSEQAFGASALLPGSGKVVVTAMDPINREDGGTVNAGGVKYLNNDTGQPDAGNNSGFIVYVTDVVNANDPLAGTFAKSVGLGDLELTCELPTYIEIGNYVWDDKNGNGVQDACESALANVNVTLYKGATKIATSKTNANGEYYFSTKAKLGAGWIGTGVDADGLLPNTAYKLVFGEGQVSGGYMTIAGGQYKATLQNASTGNASGLNDSNLGYTGGAFVINLTTPAAASVNHTYDAGFTSCPTITNPSAAQSFCSGSSGSNITVTTQVNTANSIRFVRFTSDQMAGTDPTTVEANIIYGSGTTVATVTPSGASAPYTATLTTASANWASLSAGTYYVYAVIEPDPGSGCRPVQEIVVTISGQPSVNTTNGAVCKGSSIDLSTLVTGNPTGTLTFYTSQSNANNNSNPLPNTYVTPLATTTYYVRSGNTISATCNAVAPITITVGNPPSLTVTDGSICRTGTIDLGTLVTNAGGGKVTFYLLKSDAIAGTNAMSSSIVSPTSAKTYFVRSTDQSGCFTIKEVTVFVKPVNCGAITNSGSN